MKIVDVDPSLFQPDNAERFTLELRGYAKLAANSSDVAVTEALLKAVSGYSEHLARGLQETGYDITHIERDAWGGAWRTLRQAVDPIGSLTHTVAEKLHHVVHALPTTVIDDRSGEPLDDVSRTFYQVFGDVIPSSAARASAEWLYP